MNYKGQIGNTLRGKKRKHGRREKHEQLVNQYVFRELQFMAKQKVFRANIGAEGDKFKDSREAKLWRACMHLENFVS